MIFAVTGPRHPPKFRPVLCCAVSSVATGSPARLLLRRLLCVHFARCPVPNSNFPPAACQLSVLFAYQLATVPPSQPNHRRPLAHPLFLSFFPCPGQPTSRLVFPVLLLLLHPASPCWFFLFCCISQTRFLSAQASRLSPGLFFQFPTLPSSLIGFAPRVCQNKRLLTRYDAALTRTLRTAASFSPPANFCRHLSLRRIILVTDKRPSVCCSSFTQPPDISFFFLLSQQPALTASPPATAISQCPRSTFEPDLPNVDWRYSLDRPQGRRCLRAMPQRQDQVCL